MPRRTSNYYPSQQHTLPRYERDTTQRDESSDVSFGGVISAINNLGSQVTTVVQQQTKLEQSFQAFQVNLPDKFMPRTELNDKLSTLEHADSALNARVVAMEEWRLSQTQRENDRLMAMQQQAFQAQSSTQQQISAVQQGASQEVNAQRSVLDGRTISNLFYVLLAVLGYFLGHYFK